MAAAAERSGSVISAVLFGALCASATLPFGREAFEATIRAGGVGVEASLRAFAEGLRLSLEPPPPAGPAERPVPAMPPPSHAHPAVDALLKRVHGQFSEAARPWLGEGLRRTIDYQDPAYGALYLERMARIAAASNDALTVEAARHLALWMAYEDTVRVADLKLRAGRFQRVRSEVKVADAQLLDIHEFLHPRLQEICDTLPAGLGRWLAASGAPRRWVERLTQHGRVVQTSSLRGYLMLYALAGARRWRRGSQRYQAENARIEAWLAQIPAALPAQPALALEIARCQRLVTGYGDTHERGTRHFEQLMAAARRLAGRPDAAEALRRLRDAALADDQGKALGTALAAAAN
jgi:indolepyruvate ferredoxin oxidoreductase beta subunit